MEGSSINGNKLIRVMADNPLENNPYPRYGASLYSSGSGTDVLLKPQAGVYPGTGTVSEWGTEGPFCNVSTRGRWVALEWHGKNATASVLGTQEIWFDGELISSDSNIDSYEAGNTGFNEGYVFGSTDTPWATNPGTYVYIGYFAASNTGRCANPLAA